MGPVGPWCQPKAGTVACAGRRPAYMLVVLKDKEWSHQLKGELLDKTKKLLSIKTLYSKVVLSSLLNQLTKSSFLMKDCDVADVTPVCEEGQYMKQRTAIYQKSKNIDKMCWPIVGKLQQT